ncbi:glucagon-2-like [Dromaius novaehollandiae]|uniref:glucagon-2-like n=1 Tax=Dromaius novaehollandiae TaxID=8790 RepID=UPI000E1F4185|nr:glucagon-2-like [Dromaius novaehollandiae]
MRVIGWLQLSGLVLAVLLPAGCRMGPEDLPDDSRRQLEAPRARGFAAALKRHSEGTFTSDFTHYLDRLKAKDFVHWLINTKRYSSTKRDLQEDPRGLPFPAGRSFRHLLSLR